MKKFIWALLLGTCFAQTTTAPKTTVFTNTTLFASAGTTFGATSVLDNFNRADENPLSNAGAWVCAPTWAPTGPWADSPSQVFSNQATPTGGGSGCFWNTAYGPNAEVYVTLATITTNGNGVVCLRYNTATSQGYCLLVAFGASGGAPATWSVAKDSPFNTALTSTTKNISSGDSFGLEAIGTSIKVYYKSGAGAWSEVVALAVTDSTYASSGKLVLMTGGGDTGSAYDNFGGGLR